MSYLRVNFTKIYCISHLVTFSSLIDDPEQQPAVTSRDLQWLEEGASLMRLPGQQEPKGEENCTRFASAKQASSGISACLLSA